MEKAKKKKANYDMKFVVFGREYNGRIVKRHDNLILVEFKNRMQTQWMPIDKRMFDGSWSIWS